MEHKIKALAEAITHKQAKKLVLNHVRALHFENDHLVIFLDNAAPLHELKDPEMDLHLQKGIEKIYGEAITYEYKLNKADKPHEREKEIGHEKNFNLIRESKGGRK